MTDSSSETASISTASSTTLSIPLDDLGLLTLKVNNLTQAGKACGCQVNIDQSPRQASSTKPSLHGQSTVQTGHPTVILEPVAEYHLSIPSSTTTIVSDLENTCAFHHSITQTGTSPVNGGNFQTEMFSDPIISNDVGPRVFTTPLYVHDDLPKVESDDIVSCFSLPALEARLKKLRLKRLEARPVPNYIPSRAKDTLLDSDDDCLPLMEKVQEFLDRNRSVFLLLGNSGTGKSTFLRQLERELWLSYKPGGRIPLHIDLPYIDHPECDLIEKQLRQYNFLDDEIRRLLEYRQFVIICDGYDECRLTTNLYTINGLGRRGQQEVKMIISCRSTFLGREYYGRFQPYGSDPYHDSSSDLFEEATIVPFSEADITRFVQQHFLDAQEQESKDNQPNWTSSHFMSIISTIPDMPTLVKNPFMLSLALKVLPSLPKKELDRIQATSVRLLGTFVNQWIKISKVRLERSTLSPEISAVFEEILQSEAGFEGCVELFLIRLAEAMSQNQNCHHVVEYEHSKHKKSWKAEFFAQWTKPTLLRDASPLTKTGNQHRFVHSAFFAYFRFRVVYPDGIDDDDPGGDSDDSDDDGSDGSDGSEDDGSNDDDFDDPEDNRSDDDDGDSFHINKRRRLCDSKGLADGDVSFSGSNNNSTNGNGDYRGGEGGSGGGSSSGGSGGSEGGHGTSENGGSSRRQHDGSDGDKDDPRRNPNGSRPKRKKQRIKLRRSTSSDPLATQNLFKDPEVLELLAECAASDPRLKKRLMTAIERSKSSTNPSMGAANAIVILLKSGELFHNTFLDGVSVPGDYLSEEVTKSDEQPKCILTGAGLMDALLALDASTACPNSYFSPPSPPPQHHQQSIDLHPQRNQQLSVLRTS
ncbi:hypothetical protein BGX24_001430, partial [Mortierella sp. AD032]